MRIGEWRMGNGEWGLEIRERDRGAPLATRHPERQRRISVHVDSVTIVGKYQGSGTVRR